MLPFSCSNNFGALSWVYIFRNIRATFLSGEKKGFGPRLGSGRLLTRQKFTAISCKGRRRFMRPSSLFSNVIKKIIKVEILKGQSLAYSKNMLYLCHRYHITFVIPPIFHFPSWVIGDFLILYKGERFISH